jgi:hypothetical protein
MKEVDTVIAQSPEIYRAGVLKKTSSKDHNFTHLYRMVPTTDWLQPMLNSKTVATTEWIPLILTQNKLPQCLFSLLPLHRHLQTLHYHARI